MLLGGKPFELWQLSDIGLLLDNPAYRESDTLDFKQQFDINEEFKKDVCSFANNRGGTLFYGVSEQLRDDDYKTGLAGEITGIDNIGPDGFELAIGNALASSIEPKKPRFRLRVVPLKDAGRCVLAMEVFEGRDKPYCPKQSRQFFIRGNNNKEPMSYFQLRDLFLGQSGVDSDMRRFLRERAAFLANAANSPPLCYHKAPYLGLYFAPAGAFSAQGARYAVETQQIGERLIRHIDLAQSGWARCSLSAPNADGLGLFLPGGPQHIQLFRNGAAEFASGLGFSKTGVDADALAKLSAAALETYSALCGELGVEDPVFAAVALQNMRSNGLFSAEAGGFDRNDYSSDAILINELSEPTLRRARRLLLRELALMSGRLAEPGGD